MSKLKEDPRLTLQGGWEGNYNQLYSRVKDISFSVNPLIDGFIFNTYIITANYSVTDGDTCIFADATGGNISVTLKTPAEMRKKRIVVKKTDASANTVTVVGTIDGAANYVLTTQYQFVQVESDGLYIWITGKG